MGAAYKMSSSFVCLLFVFNRIGYLKYFVFKIKTLASGMEKNLESLNSFNIVKVHK